MVLANGEVRDFGCGIGSDIQAEQGVSRIAFHAGGTEGDLELGRSLAFGKHFGRFELEAGFLGQLIKAEVFLALEFVEELIDLFADLDS